MVAVLKWAYTNTDLNRNKHSLVVDKISKWIIEVSDSFPEENPRFPHPQVLINNYLKSAKP